MWLRHPLDDILSSGAKVALLRVICASTVPLSGREVSRRARVDPGHASRVLRELAASGVVLSRDMGTVAAYELGHPDLPITQQLQALFAGEAQRYHDVSEAFRTTLPGVVSVILFGSEARHDATSRSDTDLLIVVRRKTESVENAVSEACLRVAAQYGLALSWQVADLADLRQWEATGNPLWRSVTAEGIRLTGQSLERLRREWQPGKST
jgi:predicted nucleotidyltransferase